MALAIYDSYSSFSENEDVFDKEYIREYSTEGKGGEQTINNSDSSTVSSSLLHSSSFNSNERAHDWRSKLTYYYYLIFTRKNIILFFAVLFTVITATANNILFYKISLPYVNYPFFLVLYSSAFSVPFYWFIVLIIILVPRWKHLITREMMMFAIWKFAVLGFLDAVQSILQFFSDSHVPGATQQLLQQAVIPITMIASILFLKTKYSMGQYIGATVIVLGIFIDIIPAFSDPESDLYAPISWTLIFLFSSLPFALSYLYKEVIFRDVNMSLFYLMAMDSNFQLLFNIVLTPVDAIPKFGSSPNLYSVYENLWYGCLCFMGVNSLPGDDCSGSWILLVEYAFFNISINLFLLYLLQQESTAFMFLAMTLSVPIANICFSFPIIMGSAATSLSWFDIAALIVIIIGLLLYRFTTKTTPAPH